MMKKWQEKNLQNNSAKKEIEIIHSIDIDKYFIKSMNKILEIYSEKPKDYLDKTRLEADFQLKFKKIKLILEEINEITIESKLIQDKLNKLQSSCYNFKKLLKDIEVVSVFSENNQPDIGEQNFLSCPEKEFDARYKCDTSLHTKVYAR